MLHALCVVAGVGCSSSSTDEVPFATAESLRGITFTNRPRVVRRTREEYTRVQAAKGQNMSDAEVAELRGIWGRLGFFPASFDVRTSAGEQTSLVGAFYDPSEKALTVFENDEPYILVHELVHALQDQAFDLTKFDQGATSTDELFARRAVVEGDATLNEYRFTTGGDVATLAAYFRRGDEETRSESAFSVTSLPRYFAAYQSFVYPYGALYVARRDGLANDPPNVSPRAGDDAFGAAAPKSTLDVVRLGQGQPAVPMVDVGLSTLPTDLAARFDVTGVDRIGMWFTHLLLKTPVQYALDWNGDQLVVLEDHTTALDAPAKGPSNIVWTTSWATADSARAFANRLDELFGATTAVDHGKPVIAHAMDDGESYWLEQRDTRVVLAKGTAADALPMLASAALAPALTTKMAPRGGSRLLHHSR